MNLAPPRDLFREAARRIEGGETLGLATLVATRGSTPQKVGARLLAGASGLLWGTLGGGAVEAEAVEEARKAAASGQPALREYSLSNATDEWGLACGGTMVVFVEPLGRSALGWLSTVSAPAGPADMVAVVTTIGGDRPGARLVVRERGGLERIWTDGDPALGSRAEAMARAVIERDGAELAEIEGTQVYLEAFTPAPALVVAGAGHVGKALAGLARLLGVGVTVVDDRPEYASRERFPEVDRVVAAPVAEALGRLPIGPRTAVVVAMRNHDLDYEATAAALRSPSRYVGLVGARRKAVLFAERAATEGIPVERVRALRCPAGLDIGARTPEEIALSVLAEWITLRQLAPSQPLRLSDDLFDQAVARGVAARARQ